MSACEITVEQSWSHIDELTAMMRAAARAEEWPQVLELSGTRHLRLTQHFENFPVGPDNAAFYQQQLTAMLSGEKELQQLATNARREIMRTSSIAAQKHRAVGAYIDSARH